MIFLRSAGGRKTKRLVEAVRQCAESGDTNKLVQEVRAVGFDQTDAFFVALAVALTRDLTLPAPPAFDMNPNHRKEQLIDALGVMFMFNAINRIANFYALTPEWSELRSTEGIQRLTRPIMAFGLSFQMRLEDKELENKGTVFPHLHCLLTHLGVDPISPVWERLYGLPAIEYAICQLAWVSVNYSHSDLKRLDGLISNGSNNKSSGVASKQSLWTRLYAEPYTVSERDVTELKMDERTKLDHAFRVALLAAITKMNSSRVRELFARFDG